MRALAWRPGKKCALAALLLLLTGCSTAGYYFQSVSGHLGLMARRESIAGLLEDPATPPALRKDLRLAQRIREFASRELALPDNESYRSYVETGRRFVVWNVIAAPELSLRPRTWCFLVVGCLSYRGYFDRKDAEGFARSLRGGGLDVYMAGVRAYSTLGWFADPVLDTMLARRPYQLAAVIFHELAHQVVYVDDDTAFNEAFAVAVERTGVRRWLAGHAGERERAEYERARERHREFLSLVLGARSRLAAVYDGPADPEGKRRRKREIFGKLEADYRALRRTWNGVRAYDEWFERDLNNAKLAAVATYYDQVPAFTDLLARYDGDMAAFYDAVAALARLPRRERSKALLTGPVETPAG